MQAGLLYSTALPSGRQHYFQKTATGDDHHKNRAKDQQQWLAEPDDQAMHAGDFEFQKWLGPVHGKGVS